MMVVPGLQDGGHLRRHSALNELTVRRLLKEIATSKSTGHLLGARLAAVARHRQLNDMTERSPVEGWTECVKRE